MRVRTVVLLVNLALAIGLGCGYLWWGREARRLARQVAAVETGEREYTADGIVRAVLPELRVLVVTHPEIPGYMPPMTMGFRVSTSLRTIEVGDTVRFTARGTPPNMTIVTVDKKSP
jgi:Cu/Ag efflux protein CusF